MVETQQVGYPESAVPLLAGSRRARWRFELLTNDYKTVGPLTACSGTSLDMNVDAAVRVSGSTRYTGPEIDWTRHMVRIWYRAAARGQTQEWPLGTFMVEAPEEEMGSLTPGSVDLDLRDATYRLDLLNSSASPWVAPAGANAVQTVRDLLDRQGVRHSIQDSDVVLGSSMSWKAGTPYRRIVNDILEVPGFFAAWADPMGVIRSEYRRPPSARGVRYEFQRERRGSAFGMNPRYTRRRNLAVPNRVVLVAQSDDPDEMPVVGTAVDVSGPFGTDTTKAIRVHTEENVSPGPQDVMNARAAVRLEELQRVGSVYDIKTLPVPVDGNDVVRVVDPSNGVAASAVVEKASWRQETAEMPLTVREVAA